MLTTVSDVTDVSCNFKPWNICDYIPGSCWKLYPVTYSDYGKPCSYSSLHVLRSLLTPVSRVCCGEYVLVFLLVFELVSGTVIYSN